MEQTLSQLYERLTGVTPSQIQPIAGAGSSRRYVRLSSPAASLIGVEGTSQQENHAFIALSQHLHALGFNVPQVQAASPDEMYYLQTDLGNTSLYDLLAPCRNTGCWEGFPTTLLCRVMQQLATLQVKAHRGLRYDDVCYPVSHFDRRSILFDLNYFKYAFLKATEVEFDEYHLQDDLESLADHLMHIRPVGLMYRDFQSRNIMVHNGEPWFIDFQGCRRGPLHYDVASFLWQARAQYPPQLRDHLLRVYLDALRDNGITIDDDTFARDLQLMRLFRSLQVLGAYGFRGYFQRKALFLSGIIPAVQMLAHLIGDGVATPYPHLDATLRAMVALPRFVPEPPRTSLRVTVYSFSYRHGIPHDNSGNGGGFVFDCRAIHNPGRYPQYAHLTGRDKEVIDFLEDDGEILPFVSHTTALVDAAVEKYIKRGFTHLQVAYGCTGGRHRSVYSAQALATHLHSKYPGIEVQLIHREQNITQTLPATQL